LFQGKYTWYECIIYGDIVEYMTYQYTDVGIAMDARKGGAGGAARNPSAFTGACGVNPTLGSTDP
jgi:hypothetical protein